MKLGIIAAGEGSRLKNDGFDSPKPLINICGKSLLERLFITASLNNFESVNIIINSENLLISDFIKKFSDSYHIPYNLIIKSTPSSFHSFYELGKFLCEDNFCLSTIDSVYSSTEFSSYVESCRQISSKGLIALTGFVDDEKPLWAETDGNLNITAFTDSKGKSNYVTGGIYYFRKGVYDIAEEAMKLNINRLRNFLRFLLTRDFPLSGFVFDKIIDVDRKEDIQVAENFIKINQRN